MSQTLYQIFAATRQEIERHKYFESERAGRDVGFESALVDWNKKHRANWVRVNKSSVKEGSG